MEQWFLSTLASAAVATVLGGVAVYLFQSLLVERLKSAVKAEYDIKLETHKAQLAALSGMELEKLKIQLKSEADIAQERLKSQLQIQAAQDGIAFSRLHDRRIAAIEQTYRKLYDLHGTVLDFLLQYGCFDHETNESHFDRLTQAYADFNQDIVDHRLFLPRGIVRRLEGLHKELRDVTGRYGSAVITHGAGHSIHEYRRQYDRFVTGIQDAINELHEDMRIALGDKAELSGG